MRTSFQKHPQAANSNGVEPKTEQADLPRAGELFESEQWRLCIAVNALTLTHLLSPETGRIRIVEFYFLELTLASANPKTQAAVMRMMRAISQNATMEEMMEIAGVLAAVSGASIECRSVSSERMADAT
jgi:hypothetical protein